MAVSKRNLKNYKPSRITIAVHKTIKAAYIGHQVHEDNKESTELSKRFCNSIREVLTRPITSRTSDERKAISAFTKENNIKHNKEEWDFIFLSTIHKDQEELWNTSEKIATQYQEKGYFLLNTKF